MPCESIVKHGSLSVRDATKLIHWTHKGRRVTGVLWAFFDGSDEGTDAPKVISVCGFLAAENVWEKFEEYWNAVLDKPEWPHRLRRFHATDCVNGTEEFWDWKFAQRLAIWGDLVQVLIEAPLQPIGSVLLAEHYRALEPKVLEKMGTPYHLPVEHCIQTAIRKCRDLMPGETFGFLFDVENKPVSDVSHERYRNYMLDPRWNENLEGMGQTSSYKYIPLQAADLLAYGTYRYHKAHFYPDEHEPEFPIIAAFERLIVNMTQAEGGIYEREGLAILAQQVKDHHGIT